MLGASLPSFLHPKSTRVACGGAGSLPFFLGGGGKPDILLITSPPRTKGSSKALLHANTLAPTTHNEVHLNTFSWSHPLAHDCTPDEDTYLLTVTVPNGPKLLASAGSPSSATFPAARADPY